MGTPQQLRFQGRVFDVPSTAALSPGLAAVLEEYARALTDDASGVAGSGQAVGCPSGCVGTTDCLCGQGELSDFPVWIENE